MALDASFVVRSLNRSEPGHARAYDLYRRLIDSETVCAVCRHLLRLEFWSAWSKATRDLTPQQYTDLAREMRERLTGQGELPVDVPRFRQEAQRRHYYLEQADNLFDMFLASLNIVDIKLSRDLLQRSRRVMASAGLQPLDAVVCAIAERLATLMHLEPAVVSFDRDFRRVEGLHIWGLT